MPGHPAIATHFWPLLLITSQMTGSVVNISIIIIEPLITFLPEELLIDFQELIGQHSGENMAAVVWSTLETYNIQDKVLSKQSPSCNFIFYFFYFIFPNLLSVGVRALCQTCI
jgi:hypothetical protein